MVKHYHCIFSQTGVILYEILVNTTVIHCYLRKGVALVGVEVIVTLWIFAEMF